MSENFVKFTDSVNLVPLDIPEEVKDYYQNAAKQGLIDIKPLRVTIAATHAGKVTRNNGFYLPHKMEKGAKTFTDQYNKPIQVHHQEKEDPIGRVLEARYVDLSKGIRDSLQDSLSENEQKYFQDFVNGHLSIRNSVDFINQWIIKDLKISADPSYEGLGYIELVANITDPDAIQKVLDGRYLTGSVAATTNSAVCSVCKKDWPADGRCSHKPGKLYDGAKCVIIAGDLNYDEYSFVNKPADRHSRVIEVNLNGIQDFVTVDEEDQLHTVALVVDKHNCSKEEAVMTFKDALELAQQHERFQSIETLVDDVKKLVDEHTDLTEEKLLSLLDEAYKTVSETVNQEQTTEDSKKDTEAKTFVLDEEKLSDMIASTVAAVLAVKKEEEQVQESSIKSFDNYKEEELIELFNTVKDEMNKRNLACCEKVEDTEAVKALKAEVETLQTKLDCARKEVKYLHTDIESLTSTMADNLLSSRKLKVQYITDMRQLSGEAVQLETIEDELKAKNTDELTTMLQDCREKVDTQKIVDTLNSGLSNNPTGSVEDPTLMTDNIKPPEAKVKLSDSQKKQLRLQWLQTRTRYGQDIADGWLNETCKAFEIDTEEVVPVKEQS